MKIYKLFYKWDVERLVVDDDSLHKSIRPRQKYYLKRNEKCDLPTRYGNWVPRNGIRVKKAPKWRDFMDCTNRMLLVSDRVRSVMQMLPKSVVEFIPVSVSGPKKLGPPPVYFLMNPCRVLDAVNLTAIGACHWADSTPDMHSLCRDNRTESELVFDPSRIPKDVGFFHARYYRGLYITEPVAEALRRAKLTGMTLTPQPVKRESPTARAALVARLRREARAAAAAKPERRLRTLMRASQLESALKISLPQHARELLEAPDDLPDGDVEVFTLTDAVEATKSLRDWKELEWPKPLVCVAEDGRGGYWALDTARSKDGDCPVVYFDHELADIDSKTGQIRPTLELAARTFDAWIKRLHRGGSGLPA